MPAPAVKTEKDEGLWEKAKSQARKKKPAPRDFYAYAMSIYQQMRGEKSMQPIMIKSKVKTHQSKTKKPIEGTPMKTIDLTGYPALQKAIDTPRPLSKSLEFTKTGALIRQAIMVKIGVCTADLLTMVNQWKAGLKVKSRDDDVYDSGEMPVATTAAEEEPREPYKISNKRREIENLNRIARNIDTSKTYKLSEYELKEYGL